ncbi:G protein-coupled receptor gpr1 [Neonectria magnoliae]|uniref:G protein-coupled receptor gpr1 n=1 Tax=Neonectria magnoliae TaxID=2732573 RepID=A0ABR1H729_9HYPO
MSSQRPSGWLESVTLGWPGSSPTFDKRSNEKMAILTPDQTYSLHIASISAASLSIFAGILAMFWFVRMRRSFRHDLIMLLIGSDMFKACWFLIFPAVELVYGKVSSDSKFCNVSGFFLVMSMGASDLIITLITIHTALYIFRGQEGLYPFRKYAYPLIFFFPACMASLAFINKTAYINTGQFCYLPVAPVWTRLALSWVPRYFIFATIFATSIAIYIYVKLLMRRFAEVKDTHDNNPASRDVPGVPTISNNSTLTAPSTAYHPSVPSTASSRRGSRDDRRKEDRRDDHGRQYSVSTMSTLNVEMAHSKHYTSRLPRKSYQSMRSRLSRTGIEEGIVLDKGKKHSNPDLRSVTLAPILIPPPEIHIEDSQLSPTFSMAPTPLMHSNDSTGGFYNRYSQISAPPRPRTPSLPQIFSVQDAGSGSSRSDDSENPIVMDPTLDATGLVRTRETVRRQLRLVLIYPFAYTAIWVLPFIVHLTSYDKGAPFPMRMASISCLCLQGLVDATIFTLKEKPWKFTRPRRFGFSYNCWSRRSHHDGMHVNSGRTREEMRIDGRLAKERRDREMADRQQRLQASRRATTEWWDHDV